MKKYLFFLPILLIVISCNNKNQKKVTEELPKAIPAEKNRLVPAVIIIQMDGKIKAYRGFKKEKTGNPVYDTKDSLTGDFLLIVDPKEVVTLHEVHG